MNILFLLAKIREKAVTHYYTRWRLPKRADLMHREPNYKKTFQVGGGILLNN